MTLRFTAPEAVDDDPVVPLDLRLTVAAAAWWVGTLAAIRWGWAGSGWAAVGGALSLGVAALFRRPAGVRVAVIVMLCAVAAAACSTLKLSAIRDSAAFAMAAGHRSGQLELTVSGPPIALGPGPGGGARSLLPGTDAILVVDGRRLETGTDAVAFGPAELFAGVQPGTRVSLDGRLAISVSDRWPTVTMNAESALSTIGAPAWWRRAAGELRQRFAAAAASAGGEAAGLLPGVVLGDTGAISPALSQDAKITGLTHLLAVSGSHVAVLIGLLLLPFRRAGPRIAAVAGTALLVVLVVVVGAEPSVLRAVVMGAIALVALWSGRTRSALPALAAAVLVLLLLDPELAIEPGFALSVAATGAIVVLAPRWTQALQRRRVPIGWAALLVVPVVAHLATVPVIAALSGTVAVWAIPANILVAPAVPVVLVIGALGAALAGPLPAAADVCVWIAAPFAEWIAHVAHWVAEWPVAVVSWPSSGAGLAVLTLLCVAAPFALRFRRARLLALAVTALAAVVLIPVRVLAPGWPPADWRLVGCDVGQGDGFVIATGVPGEAVVVDTGPESSVMTRCLDRLGVTSVAMLVLTHLHADHIGGLEGVLRRGGVRLVEVGPGREPAPAWGHVLDDATRAGVSVEDYPVGTVLVAGGLTITVLGPDITLLPAGLGPNELSVVLMVEVDGIRMLMSGDIEEAAQRALLRSGRRLDADVLKLPHHGSAKLLPEFVAAVDPTVVMIGVGVDNDFGHPSPTALQIVQNVGAEVVLRTDLDGDIAATVADGVLGTAIRGPSVVQTRSARRPRGFRPARQGWRLGAVSPPPGIGRAPPRRRPVPSPTAPPAAGLVPDGPTTPGRQHAPLPGRRVGRSVTRPGPG